MRLPNTPALLGACCLSLLVTGCGKGEAEPTSQPSVPSLPSDAGEKAVDREMPAVPAPAGDDDVSSAATEAAGQLVTAYLDDMDALNDVLGNVTGSISAATASPQIASIVDRVKDTWAQLDELNPELKAELTRLYSARIDDMKAAFMEHVNRIGSEHGLDEVAATLRTVPLFGG